MGWQVGRFCDAGGAPDGCHYTLLYKNLEAKHIFLQKKVYFCSLKLLV